MIANKHAAYTRRRTGILFSHTRQSVLLHTVSPTGTKVKGCGQVKPLE
jgi:hypothetical protein